MLQLNGFACAVPDGCVAPDACVVGVIVDDPSSVQANVPRIASGERFSLELPALILDHTFSRSSLVEKTLALAQMHEMCRAGATVILISHDEDLLAAASDEIWVVQKNTLIDRGDPGEVLRRYRKAVSEELRTLGSGIRAFITPSMRKGDGRATLESIELLGAEGVPATIWTSGEQVAIRITSLYRVAVADPVIGILIRTRIGLNVYGTNTELEQITLGPVSAGEKRVVSYSFRCELCAGEYTLTAASHDPDGLWHEWLEDTVAFTVTDSRYTAGVANLRASVSVA